MSPASALGSHRGSKTLRWPLSRSEKLRASGAVLKGSRSCSYRADISKVRQKMSLCRMQPLPLLTSQVPHAGCQASRPSTVGHSWEGQILGACHPS